MKIKFIYIAPLLALLMIGCLKNNDNNPNTNVPLPSGIFTGQFLRIHRVGTTGGLDTIKANLILTMSQTTGFAVTGDTTLHAGSFGGYAVNAYYIQFVDHSAPSVKYHLNGVYNYIYNGDQFDINATYGDTLSYQYNLVKKN